MKGFKIIDGDISITDGLIDMVDGLDLETQTIKTVLGTNKGESPFNSDEGIDFKQILGKGHTEDQIRSQIQSGIHQVNSERSIYDFSCSIDNRNLTVEFTTQSNNGTITDSVTWG